MAVVRLVDSKGEKELESELEKDREVSKMGRSSRAIPVLLRDL